MSMTDEQVDSCVRNVLSVSQNIEMRELTYHTALLRVLGSPEKVSAYVSTEVNQTILHQRCQEKYMRIRRTYEVESRHHDLAIKSQAANNVINAISQAVEPAD